MRPRRHEQNQTSFRSRAARTPGVRKVRRTAGRFGAPGLNPEFEAMRSGARSSRSTGSTVTCRPCSTRSLPRTARHDCSAGSSSNWSERVDGQIQQVGSDVANLGENVTAFAGDIDRLDGHIVRLNGHIQDDLWPLMARAESLTSLNETVAWLVQRVETVRAEMMHELRYGQPRESDEIDVEIVNPAAAESADALRLNLGCGHIPLDGFVNVDMRKLPGVDVVAPLDALPFDAETVDEIFSAHVLEHFPQEALERRFLPYWYSVLAPGGVFRSVVPDVDAMIDQYREGTITFENLRQVVYGGQEYEGDFHHTAFTPESLSELLVKAGFVDVELVERGRENGACLEFELTARRPA